MHLVASPLGRDPKRLYLRYNGFVLAAAVAEGLDDAPQLFSRTTCHRNKAIRPGADPVRRFRCHRGPNETGSTFRPRVELGFFDDDAAAMRYRLAGPQRPYDIGAFLQSRIAFGFSWPILTRDGLIKCLTATERHPEPIREHYGEGRTSLCEHSRMIPPPGADTVR